MNIYQLIKERSTAWSNHPAIHDEQGSMTYIQLFNAAEKLSAQLKNSGLKKGMCLGIMSKNSREFIIAILAGLHCETIVLPLSNKLTKDELQQIADETQLHFLLDDKSDSALKESDSEIEVGEKNWRIMEVHAFKEQFAPHVKNPAFIRFTSGTTGKSKGVIVSHESVKERIEAANTGLQLAVGDAVVWVLPIAYHFIVSIILYLYYGSAIVLCNDFMAKVIVNFAEKFKGTLLYCSPMHIRLLAGDESLKNLGGLRKIISTSAGISPGLCEKFKQKFAVPVSQAFGIIEVGLPIINFEKSAEYPEAVGYALHDYTVEVLDDAQNILPAGATGNLAIKGPGMFDGYLNPQQTRAQILKDGWFLTGDLASKTKEGLIKIEGREKSVINVSGNKVFPEEVEAVIEAHPAVKTSRVFGSEHPLLGEMVEAEVMLNEGITLEREELLHFCRMKLTSFKLPQKIRFVSTIEKTGSGKVVRF